MRTVVITFTHEGMKVAEKASSVMDGENVIYCHSRCSGDYSGAVTSFDSVGAVVKNEFNSCDRMLFICAAAIAVRSIAPYLKSKVTDPAVLVADESGRFLISLLSGHIGGANEWCEELAEAVGAVPVITTATDTRGMFAVDLFAKRHNMRIVNPAMIKEISGKILNGEPVGLTGSDTFMPMLRCTEARWNGQVYVTDNNNGEYESGIQIITQTGEQMAYKKTLKLVPMDIAVGIGCKKGKSVQEIEEAVNSTFAENNLLKERIAVVSSIDIKADEPGIAGFARKYRVPYKTYSAEELSDIKGDFAESAFVKEKVGVDNVCERSACAASGGGDRLVGKTACDGVTVAVYKITEMENSYA